MFKKIVCLIMAGALALCAGACSKTTIQSGNLTQDITAQKSECRELNDEFRAQSMDFAFELYKNID